MPAVSCGALSQRVVVQRKAAVARAEGPGSTGLWEDWGRVWANVIPPAATQAAADSWWLSHGMYQFDVRRRSNLDEDMRLEWGGWSFIVRFINPVSSNAEFMTLFAEREEAI